MAKKTALLLKTLGWAHHEGRPVLMHLLTYRDSNMLISGGSFFVGEVIYDPENGGPYTNWYREEYPRIPREVRRAAVRARIANDQEEDRVRSEDGRTWARFASLPTTIRVEGNHGYVIALTDDEACDVAYAAGLRVAPGHPYAGPGWGFADGSYWRDLAEHQLRQTKTA
jgi:hypothetical protein